MRDLVAKLRSFSPNRLLVATVAGSLAWHVVAVFLFSTVFYVKLGVEAVTPIAKPLVVKQYGGTGGNLTLEMTVKDILSALEIRLPEKRASEGLEPLAGKTRAGLSTDVPKVADIMEKPSFVGGDGLGPEMPGVGAGRLPGAGKRKPEANRTGVALELKGERRVIFYPPPPPYPGECEKAGIEGDVVLSFEISPEGEVVRARVLRMSGCSLLDQTALEYIRKFRFNRARETTLGKITVRFRFRSGGRK